MTCTSINSHLEWHQHAFLDANNAVVDLFVFDASSHGSNLLIEIANGRTVVCCCEHGIPSIGQYWDPNAMSWIAPMVNP
jgi:hypothetical protein